MSAGQSAHWGYFWVDDEWVEVNNCVDPCKGQRPYFPNTLFRDSGDLQTLTMNQIDLFFEYYGESEQLEKKRYFFALIIMGSVMAPFVVLQGLWVACSAGRKSAIEARNALYIFICDLHLPFQHKRRARRPWQKTIAKYAALASYLWAILASALCIPMLIVTVVSLEIWLNVYPQSETSAHIGAWTPWAGTGLVLISAFVSRYGTAEVFIHLAKFEWITPPSWMMRSAPVTGIPSHGTRDDPARPQIRTRRGTKADQRFRSSYNVLKAPLSTFIHWCQNHWRSLKDFYHNPESVRSQNYDPIDLMDRSGVSGVPNADR